MYSIVCFMKIRNHCVLGDELVGYTSAPFVKNAAPQASESYRQNSLYRNQYDASLVFPVGTYLQME
jgi:hypothetical protein